MFSFPQWHGLTQTHFPPWPRKTAWHGNLTNGIWPTYIDVDVLWKKQPSQRSLENMGRFAQRSSAASGWAAGSRLEAPIEYLGHPWISIGHFLEGL